MLRSNGECEQNNRMDKKLSDFIKIEERDFRDSMITFSVL